MFNTELSDLVSEHLLAEHAEERLEAEAVRTLYIEGPDLAAAIDFGVQMAVFKVYQLIKTEHAVYGFAGTADQVRAKLRNILGLVVA